MQPDSYNMNTTQQEYLIPKGTRVEIRNESIDRPPQRIVLEKRIDFVGQFTVDEGRNCFYIQCGDWKLAVDRSDVEVR